VTRKKRYKKLEEGKMPKSCCALVDGFDGFDGFDGNGGGGGESEE